MFEEAGLSVDHTFTARPDHARHLIQELAEEGERNFIVIGGDGTLHEVVNGVMFQDACASTDICLALFPIGTGNDWTRTHNYPKDFAKVMRAITVGDTFLQDVGLCHYHENGQEQLRYFVNVAGCGFDAYVGDLLEKGSAKGLLSSFSYYYYLLKGLTTFERPLVHYKVSGVQHSEEKKEGDTKIFTMTAAICKYFGGGMKIAPEAIPDDGLLDITLVNDLSNLEIARVLPTLYSGKFMREEKIDYYQAKSASIQTEAPIRVQLDGELFGYGPFRFSLRPKAIRFIAAKK